MQACEHDVVADRTAERQPLLLAVLRNERHAAARGVFRRAGDALALEADLARRDAVRAEDRARDLGAARADQAAQADDLAGAYREADVGDPVVGRETFDVEQQLARVLAVLARIGAVDRTPDHQAHQVVRRGLGGQHRGDPAAVAQHRDAVAEREHLRETVRDVDDRDAALPQPPDDGEQPLGLAIGQCGGRLVHHQDARVLRQRLGDLDHLLLRDAERVHRGARIDIEADHVEHAARLRIEPRAVDETRHAAAKLAPKIDVLRDVEIGNEGEFLEDDRDAKTARIGRRCDLDGPAVVQQFAGVGAVGAAQHLHQGRFSGAVLAEQHVNFAGAKRERHVVERLHAGELLGNAAQLEQRNVRVARHGRLRRDVPHRLASFPPYRSR